MSDKFIALATKEINDEISGIETILSSCKNDDDVNQNSSQLQRHTHKIKGLAPMMGKGELGDLSSQLDTILKKIIEGKQVQGIFDIFIESLSQMKNSMIEPNFNLSQINNKIKHILLDL